MLPVPLCWFSQGAVTAHNGRGEASFSNASKPLWLHYLFILLRAEPGALELQVGA